MKVAHVSTFPSMKCGIAFYVSDLIGSLPMVEHRKYALHYGTNVTEDAAGHANASDFVDIRELAHAISQSDCDVVSLQHEFGIWGGPNGEHVLDFLGELAKPLVSTLHTTFRYADRPAVQSSILRTIIDRSVVSFVLSQQSKETMYDTLGLTGGSVDIVPHGIPDIPFAPSPLANNHAGGLNRTVKLCSVGFFRPDKGLEETLKALSRLRERGTEFLYVIAGSPQPQFAEQRNYLGHLNDMISELALDRYVKLDVRFLTREEQVQIIQDNHVGVFAYQTPYQSSSGAIPLVIAAGRPVICTPFEYALAKNLEIGDGVFLTKNFGSDAIADAILDFSCNKSSHGSLELSLHQRAKDWLWRSVGTAYSAAFNKARETNSRRRSRTSTSPAPVASTRRRPPSPKPRSEPTSCPSRRTESGSSWSRTPSSPSAE